MMNMGGHHHGVDFEVVEAAPRATRNVFAFD
jgi:hypothetical protein